MSFLDYKKKVFMKEYNNRKSDIVDALMNLCYIGFVIEILIGGCYMKYEPKIEKEIMCPIEFGLDIFGGKWKSRIICVLSSKDLLRYNEIRK